MAAVVKFQHQKLEEQAMNRKYDTIMRAGANETTKYEAFYNEQREENEKQ